MVLARIACIAILLTAAAPVARTAGALEPGTGSSEHSRAISLRKRVHVNTLITEPGTIEIEWGGAFSVGGDFTFPAAIKYTPEGRHAYWGRTEFSASFDSLSSNVDSGTRVTNFSDRVSFAATCVVHDGDKLDVAFAPQVSVLLRGGQGARLGATAIARYDAGRSSAGVTLTWTAPTASSDTNPAGTMDIGAGYGFRLKPSGPLGHLTPHTNWLYEKSTGAQRQVSVFEGVEYQITDKFAVDFSAQHFSVWGGSTDHQIVVGLTVNTGRLRGERH
ncbi:MAG: hypothetical protein LAQ69_44880 [Acidobacteriia bacterium]|nr:hypothetical protein [Terriglobia bacterium]